MTVGIARDRFSIRAIMWIGGKHALRRKMTRRGRKFGMSAGNDGEHQQQKHHGQPQGGSGHVPQAMHAHLHRITGSEKSHPAR